MSSKCSTGYQDIAQVNKKEIQLLADGMHKMLKGLCYISEAKWHSEILKQSKWGNYGIFRMSSLLIGT